MGKVCVYLHVGAESLIKKLLLLTSYLVKYFRVPSLSERTNRLLRNCPLSRPLFINMPSLIPAEHQKRSLISMNVLIVRVRVCECVYLLTFLIREALPRFRELLPLVLCPNPLLPQNPEYTDAQLKRQQS